MWKAPAEHIEKNAGIGCENLPLAGVHTHGAPTSGLPAGGPPGLHYTIVETVRQAGADVWPACGLRRGARRRQHEP